ncbi:MAG: hypothetical protein ACLRMZ_14310 [Blautia marasmi]
MVVFTGVSGSGKSSIVLYLIP